MNYNNLIKILCFILLLSSIVDITVTYLFLKNPMQEDTVTMRWLIENLGLTNAMLLNLVLSCLGVLLYYHLGCTRKTNIEKQFIIIVLLICIYARGYLGAASWIKELYWYY